MPARTCQEIFWRPSAPATKTHGSGGLVAQLFFARPANAAAARYTRRRLRRERAACGIVERTVGEHAESSLAGADVLAGVRSGGRERHSGGHAHGAARDRGVI